MPVYTSVLIAFHIIIVIDEVPKIMFIMLKVSSNKRIPRFTITIYEKPAFL